MMMLAEMRWKGSSPLNVDYFEATQTILVVGIAETFDMSSRRRSTIKVENSWL